MTKLNKNVYIVFINQFYKIELFWFMINDIFYNLFYPKQPKELELSNKSNSENWLIISKYKIN